jgi:hypothetical protein
MADQASWLGERTIMEEDRKRMEGNRRRIEKNMGGKKMEENWTGMGGRGNALYSRRIRD